MESASTLSTTSEDAGDNIAGITGIRFHNYLPTNADLFTSALGDTGCAVAPLTNDISIAPINTALIEEQEGVFSSDEEVLGELDTARPFQAGAILSEYDIMARKKATDLMRYPPYNHLAFGQPDYFDAYERLVRMEVDTLRKKYGPPKSTFDGLTKLPMSVLYNDLMFDSHGRPREGRRHSLAVPASMMATGKAQQREKRKIARHMSLAITDFNPDRSNLLSPRPDEPSKKRKGFHAKAARASKVSAREQGDLKDFKIGVIQPSKSGEDDYMVE